MVGSRGVAGGLARRSGFARAGQVARGGYVARRHEIAHREVDRHRLAGVRHVAAVLDRQEARSGGAGELAPVGVGPDAVVPAMNDEHGAAHAARERELLGSLERRRVGGHQRADQRLGIGLVRPLGHVLDLLGRVRLAETQPDEPVDEVVVVRAQVLGVELQPRPRRQRPSQEERPHARVAHEAHAQAAEPAGREHRADEHRAEDALRVLDGEQQPALDAARVAEQDRALGARGVHHVERVAGELRLRVRVDLLRAIRAAVAARIERHRAEVAREVGDLRLPQARVDERPARQEQHRRLAVAVGLPEDAHAVALDIARLVRVVGPRLLAGRGGGWGDGQSVHVTSKRKELSETDPSRAGSCVA
jgi:hypothetical protein